MVNGALVRQDLERRGIVVTDQEIVQARADVAAARAAGEPRAPDGRPVRPREVPPLPREPGGEGAGLLQYLEQYYRSEIPRQKLFAQVASDVYVSDARLWTLWQDTYDSARVTYAAFRPELLPDSAVKVSDAEISAFYDKNRKSYDRPGRAVVSLVAIPRAVTAADSAAAREKAAALRAEIAGGAKFEDVARRESADSGSGAQGGALGRGPRGRFVPEFEQAAYALAVGELSQPVQTLVRLPHHPRRRAAGRHAGRAPHPRPHGPERLQRRAHGSPGGPGREGRRGDRGSQEVRRGRREVPADARHRDRDRERAADLERQVRAERQRVGVRWGQGRRVERPVRLARGVLSRAPRLRHARADRRRSPR